MSKLLFGKEHPDTLTTMGSLAGVLEPQEKYDEAEKMHRQTLDLMEQCWKRRFLTQILPWANLPMYSMRREV